MFPGSGGWANARPLYRWEGAGALPLPAALVVPGAGQLRLRGPKESSQIAKIRSRRATVWDQATGSQTGSAQRRLQHLLQPPGASLRRAPVVAGGNLTTTSTASFRGTSSTPEP